MDENILVIAAHPDDEALGCGGTIARLAGEGYKVHILILGEGITSRDPAHHVSHKGALETLRDHTQKAISLLGGEKLYLQQFPDNRFDTIPLLDIIKIIEKLIAEIKPRTIYTHHAGDLNIDHAITARAVLTATRPVEECMVKELLSFEIPSSTEWGFSCCYPLFVPNVFVDIERTLDKKINAIKAYESEVRRFPHPRSPEALKALAEKWGATSGFKVAEAFYLIRSLR